MSTTRPIYLDVTDTYWTALQTGIQRVVRNISARSTVIAARTGRPCISMVWYRDRFVPINHLPQGKRAALAQHLQTLLERSAQWAQRALERRVSRDSRVYRATRALWRSLREPVLGVVARVKMAAARRQPIIFEPGDVVVLLDAYWGYSSRDTARTAVALPAKGVQVFVVAYDLFPLTHPALYNPEQCLIFSEAFESVFGAASGILAISHAIRGEIQGYLQAHYPSWGRIPTSVFHLGADIPRPPHGAQAKVRPVVAQLAARGDYYLCVGTLEPRKGYRHVLDAFEERWRNDSTLELCMVGRLGWKYEADLYRIQNSPQLNQRLFLLNDATDAEVALLYRHCRATILASQTEGFGLPMVEAMAVGARVIANDVPIFREIGGTYPLYYAYTGARMNLAIDEMERRIASGERPAPHLWLTWDESAAQFADALAALMEQPAAEAPARVVQAQLAD